MWYTIRAFVLQNHRKTQFHTANHVHFLEQKLWNVCGNLHFISFLAKFAVTFVDDYSKFSATSFFLENTKHYLMASVLHLYIYVAVMWRELRVLFVSVIFDLHFRRRHETYLFLLRGYTDKKIKFFSYTYKEIQSGAVAKSYMTNGLLNGEIFAHFLVY